MSILDTILSPDDLRALPSAKLPSLADEIRKKILDTVGANGGHLASNLGIVELTMALHRCFNTPEDRILFDVGHQCYPHKLLTGRNARFHTLRKEGGVSGFPAPSESEFDQFSVGHAGTAIATAVGLARGDQTMNRNRRTVAMVGDASIVNGLSFEALNAAGILNRQFLVILNDNSWGISPTQGALARHLIKFRNHPLYEDIRDTVQNTIKKLPLLGKTMYEAIDHLKEGIKATLHPHQVFEYFGFQYVGPVDGHDINQMIEIFETIRDIPQPVLLHVHTDKGCGCDWAIADPNTFHSPAPFTVDSGKVTIHSGEGKSWTRAFSDSIIQLAKEDERIVALTAAMPSGTGLSAFSQEFPDRYHDIGIAESCTVDIAAGMCKAGLKPIVAIYSTFLQRGFDQVFQEVSLQGLPVVFCMDRAGLVGSDGAVHHGFLDIAFLRGLPGVTLIAPADEPDLVEAMKFAVSCGKPVAIRYPRDMVSSSPAPALPFEMGVSRRLREGADATILAYGTTVSDALWAAEFLSDNEIEVGVVNARFASPIDKEMVSDAFSDGTPVIMVEDHSIAGGFGSAVLETAQQMRLNTANSIRLGLPADRFIAHGSRTGQKRETGIDGQGIALAIQQLLHGKAVDLSNVHAGTGIKVPTAFNAG